MNTSVNAASTSSLDSRRATTMPRLSRVTSSITVSLRNFLPSWVRSSTEAQAQTWFARSWFARSGRSRMQEPSASHRRPRFGCRCGTFSPSRRQIRSTRLAFTTHPERRSSAVIRR